MSGQTGQIGGRAALVQVTPVGVQDNGEGEVLHLSLIHIWTVVGRGSSIYPVSCVRGAIPAGSIVKTGGVMVQRS